MVRNLAIHKQEITEYRDPETPRCRPASSSDSSSKEYEENQEEGEHCCGGSWLCCGGDESKSDDGDHEGSYCKCVVM